MILYKNNRFHLGGLSFSLPENVCLIPKETEYANPDGLIYSDCTGKIEVITNTVYSELTAAEFLKTDEVIGEATPIGDVTEFEIDGIKAACLYCESKREECFEVAIELPIPGNEERLFTLCALVKKGDLPIKDAANSPAVTELLASIKKYPEWQMDYTKFLFHIT